MKPVIKLKHKPKLSQKVFDCECMVQNKNLCWNLLVINFGKGLIEINLRKKKKVLGGVVLKVSDLLKFVK